MATHIKIRINDIQKSTMLLRCDQIVSVDGSEDRWCVVTTTGDQRIETLESISYFEERLCND